MKTIALNDVKKHLLKSDLNLIAKIISAFLYDEGKYNDNVNPCVTFFLDKKKSKIIMIDLEEEVDYDEMTRVLKQKEKLILKYENDKSRYLEIPIETHLAENEDRDNFISKKIKSKNLKKKLSKVSSTIHAYGQSDDFDVVISQEGLSDDWQKFKAEQTMHRIISWLSKNKFQTNDFKKLFNDKFDSILKKVQFEWEYFRDIEF